jgi:hypothetical protein
LVGFNRMAAEVRVYFLSAGEVDDHIHVCEILYK